MNQPYPLLKKLTDSALQMNKGLVVLCSLASVLVGLSFWGLSRMVEEQRDAVRYHFARLTENIGEQDLFLSAIAEQSAKRLPLNTQRSQMYSNKPLPEEGPDVHKVQELSFSLPFSVAIDPAVIAPAARHNIFVLGAHLASYYSAFWSASHYQSPQVFLFNLPDKFDIAVPAAGQLRGAGQIQGGAFSQVMADVMRQLHAANPGALDGRVHWARYDSHIGSAPPTVLAYINFDMPTSQLNIPGASTRMIVASLLNLAQINDIERMMQWSIYDRFSLTAPNGALLIGPQQPGTLSDGLNLRLDGLVFKISSSGPQRWTAVYVVGFKNFIDYAWWPLLGLATLILASIGGSWAFNRWYKSRVVLPAREAHASIAESEAFSRAVIDTAPTGLCVVRRSDHQVLLENQHIQAWQQSDKLIAALDHQHPLTKPGQTELEFEGRHLHVAFVSAHYRSQEVWICVFHDETRHIEDAIALQAARQAADSANAAKTRFLATMSHEIRTPLYGVLGTLELLGLTDLAPRQQEYLRTIQRSSATLFQLISDVLDVSKIEAGQMSIEEQAFCPLALTEDTLRAYCAFAQAKGLQLYACIDASVPDLVRGDPLRIRQILNNLLSNAIKFTDSGRVVVRLQVLDDATDVASLQWQVSDSGIGISQSQQTQLFDPFYQVRDASSEAGAGLGLAICWWLCELMGGHLKVISEPGLGSSFSLSLDLPCVAGPLGDCPVFPPSTPILYVQAPAPELAQHICSWLNRLGQQTCIVTQDLKHQLAPASLLLEMLSPDHEPSWHGARVIATAGGPNPAEYSAEGWRVDAHDVRAIAWAVSFAQHGSSMQPPAAQAEQARRLGLNILVAEDNPINQAIIKEQLEALGCTVVATSNGEQALHQWTPGVFDMVLTDINMPTMNGYELTRALRRIDPDVPIIGVTANALRDEGERCTAAGMNAWLVKPLNLRLLRTQLLKHCRAPRTSYATVSSVALDTQPSDNPPQLSPRMRTLFLSTMQQDIDKTKAALEHNDAAAVAQRLHSMAGALGAVQSDNLSDSCVALENQLAGATLTPALIHETETVLGRLAAMLDALT
ncbi:hybrid sensor histidine kinase/response regulator [Pseudomonas sp. RA_105y_Pfl2_P56]|uniref:hybrid sensor histidine kinase/response regulator n=1 Tax=Pseudomonas sp. RA_105y_Pfl2_P56 TaxID=3088701 RepID=UPI0030DD110B